MNYHAHIYWATPEHRATALALRPQLSGIGCVLGRVWDELIGPHPLPMFQVNYSDSVKQVVEQLLAESELTVLLHEDTGDDLRDHTVGARWLGQQLELDLVWLEAYVRNQHA